MSIFPSLSSDWLLLQVQLTIVQSREAAGSSKSSLETLFQDKIDELVNMNSDVSVVARSDGETPMSIAGFEKDMFKKLDCEPDQVIGCAKIYTMLPKNNMDFSNQLDLLFVAAEATFLRMMGTRKIECIKYIENEGLKDRFLRCKKRFHDQGTPKDERLVFHGTKTKESLESIIQNSLQLSCCKTFAQGYGIYFSEFPTFTEGYGQHMLLCRVMVGNPYLGPGAGAHFRIPQGFNSRLVAPDGNGKAQQILIDQEDQILPAFIVELSK